MKRLTARGLATGDEAARAAAIAAMGHRLAAAGPRTRQRVLRRGQASDIQCASRVNDSLAPAAVAEPDALPRFLMPVREATAESTLRPPAAPGTIRVASVLAASAGCAFALVLFAESALKEKVPHEERVTDRIAPAAAVQTISLPSSVVGPAEPRVEMETVISMPPPVRIASSPALLVQLPDFAPSAPERHADWVPSSVQSRIAASPPKRAATHHSVLQAALIISPKTPAKRPEAHPVRETRIELPRWLTEDHPTPERGLVMSEPPHNLVLPLRPTQPTPQPPESRAPIVVASSAPTQLPPLREPGYRPY